MNRLSVPVLVVGVCLLFAVEVSGETQKPGGGRSVDAASTVSSSVEPDSPATSSTFEAGPQANGASPGTIVPRLMKFSGALRDAAGKPLTGTVDVTFSLYSTEAGGEPLWFETQSVQGDDLGRYTALLGAMHTDGLPIDLFTSGEAHWLGIQVGLEAEQQPRVLLVSVPYALKAGDAETLGGKPASAYVLADTQNGSASATTITALTATAAGSGKNQNTRKAKNSPLVSACSNVTSGAGGTANSVALFTALCNIESANIFQSNGNVGIGTTSPQASLQIGSGFGGYLGFKLVTWDSSAQEGVAIGYSGAANSIQGRSGSNGGLNSNLVLNPYGGNIGIGTIMTSPQAPLQIGDGFGSYVGFKLVTWDSSAQEGVAIGYYGAANSIQGRSGPDGGINSNLTLNPYGGNVGIGTTTPAATLDVAQTSNGGTAVQGTNTAVSSYGTLGTSVSGNSTGVYGNAAGYGLYGEGGGGTGVYGHGNIGLIGNGGQEGVYATGSTGVYGIGTSIGLDGQGGTTGEGVYGGSTSNNGVHGYSSTSHGVFGESGYLGVLGSATTYGVYGQSSNYGVYSGGPFAATGAKSAVVALQDDRVVELYATESPEVWFEDFGTATLASGVAEVTLDPTFALTVNTQIAYHVFLTPNGDCEGLFVAEKTPGGFQVRELRGGKSNISFDYRIVARRRGFESVRLQEVDADTDTVATIREENHARASRPVLRIPKNLAAPQTHPEGTPVAGSSPGTSER